MRMWSYWRRSRFLIPALAVVVVAGVAACSGGNKYSGTSATSAPAAAASSGSTSASTASSAPAPTTAAAAPTGSSGAETAASGASGGGDTYTISLGSGPLGSYLTGPDGKTLYVFLKDAPSTSNCTAGCLQIWPPLLQEEDDHVQGASGVSGTFAYIDTPAGEQVTYNGAPLYYFSKDTAPGQTQGNLFGGLWFVARPDTASTALVGVHDGGGKTFLVGPTGGSLYFFSKDATGVSNCSGSCAQNWPALTVPQGIDPTAVSAAGGSLAVITRDDGTRQLTYNGHPVYYYAGDHVPGDTNGDGVGGVWSLATS